MNVQSAAAFAKLSHGLIC